MNVNKWLLLSLLLLFTFSCGTKYASPKAVKGVIDLKKVDFEKHGIQSLSGKWEFYWEQLLTPQDFRNKNLNPEYIYAPQGWGTGKENSKKYPAFGYATYRLKVLLPENNIPYRIWINSIVSSSKIWINGQFLAEAGTVATSSEKGEMGKHNLEEYFYKEIYPSGGEMEIVIQVSNFDANAKYAGLITDIKVGTQRQIKIKDNLSIIPAFLTIGILLSIALYHFILYFYRKSELSTLIFALTSFIFVFRIFYEKNLISRFIAPQTLIWLKLFYMHGYTYSVLISLFFYLLFKEHFNKKVLYSIIVLNTILIIFSFAAPLLWLTNLQVILLTIVTTIIYLVTVAFRAMLAKTQGAVWAFIGILVLLLANVYDILGATGVIAPFYISSYGIVIYVMFQAMNIAERFSISFKKNTFLNTKLDLQNKNLEQIVGVRTQEIRVQQEEVMVINENLENKSAELQNKNKAITDSIRYAKTIQQATLPSISSQKRLFSNSFVIYRPKDIVSGDFFWMKEFKNIKFIACVDCTGHGVPGAFMSMIGNNLLNEALNHKYYVEPSQILNYLNDNIRNRLNQGENKNSDGMDLSICKFEQVEHGKTKLTYAGAKGIIYVMKNKELLILKVDRCSIGGIHLKKEGFVFQDFELELEEGNLIYLATDGYIDQANNERKRFGTTKFRKLIEQVHQLPIEEQQIAFETALDEHQEEAKQRDDITVIGIRV
jgi:serine phosphatase RsbU (regulator of sigma subunit)